MEITSLYEHVRNNINEYFLENIELTPTNKHETNIVLDIEVCPNNEGTKAITYSIAIMSCDNNENICYKYNNVQEVLNMLMRLKCEKTNVYIHNLFYDIKPFLIKFIEGYGNNPLTPIYKDIRIQNPFKKNRWETIKVVDKKAKQSIKPFQYEVFLKKGQLYGAKFFGTEITNRRGERVPKVIQFFDTYKLVPYTLQRCCKAFLGLELPKDGLDYDKVRSIDDKLTEQEKGYIYDDVFGLSHLVKKLIIDGLDVHGKMVQYSKITNSSQSLYDYKMTLLEDYEKKQNAFKNQDFNHDVESRLTNTFFMLTDKKRDKKANQLFKAVFPVDNIYYDGWIRNSYYGGLSHVDFDNVKKYEKYKKHNGVVFDVNSLYPYQMQDKLLPYGRPKYFNIPYSELDINIKEEYPLYIQEIEIHDMKIKKGKMEFVQVKDNKDFNGREVIKENRNLKGEKVSITLRLCNPLLDLLFECYDVKSYTLKSCMCFTGSHDLFKNYLEFWGEVKKTSKGANREIAKLRQNALYGKFGSTGDNEISNVVINNSTFGVKHTHSKYYSDTIYIAMSSFITSYAKVHLVKAINENRERFLYCDTDSIHLYGDYKEVKGIEIDDKIYGAWAHEMTFKDFKYVGSKRYAEQEINTGKWDIKCCGLSDNIMKQLDDISVFQTCEYTPKELKNIKYYTKKDSIYYYKDKECTIKIKGLIKSKKAKLVNGGTLILETPYQLTQNKFLM